MKIKTEKCIICQGTGYVYGVNTVPDKCKNCSGSGTIQIVEFENTPVKLN